MAANSGEFFKPVLFIETKNLRERVFEETKKTKIEYGSHIPHVKKKSKTKKKMN